MGRSDKLTGEICIEVNGEIIPYLLIDADNNVTWLVSDEDRQTYERAMLKNMGECMSRYCAQHPEEL